MRMIHLEHQAQANYYALSALGPNFPCIPDELIQEMVDAPPQNSHPHFKDRLAQLGVERRFGGSIWSYYEEMVSSGL